MPECGDSRRARLLRWPDERFRAPVLPAAVAARRHRRGLPDLGRSSNSPPATPFWGMIALGFAGLCGLAVFLPLQAGRCDQGRGRGRTEGVDPMSKLLVKADKGHGRVAHVTPESAGWTYVGFDLHRLKPGETRLGRDRRARGLPGLRHRQGQGAGRRQGSRPARRAHVALRGQAVVGLCARRLRLVGDGRDRSGTRRLLGAGPGGGLPVRVIAPDDLGQEVRGKGTNTRYVTNILPEGEPADSLLVVEVITPGGHTSSYPPHKHDQDNLPAESYLEETYYHRLNPPQGFAFQRVYTDAPASRARRGDGGRGRRRGAGAEGLSPLRRLPRLRPLLSQRHGRAEADVEVPQCAPSTSG